MRAFLARGIGLHEEKNLEEKKEEEKKQSENVLWMFQGPFFTYSSRVEKTIHFHDAFLVFLKIFLLVFFSFLFASFFPLYPWNLIDTLPLVPR